MKIPLLFICITFSSLSFGQKKKYPDPPPHFTRISRNNSVKFTLQKRISLYPFSESVQIKIVSFGSQLEGDYKLPRLNDTICFSKLDEIRSLTFSQIDTLTDILFNECSRWTISIYSKNGCYSPRHAILFFDNAGKVFEYIEICFECSDIRLSSAKIREPDLCNTMYERLKDYFTRTIFQTSAFEPKKNDR